MLYAILGSSGLMPMTFEIHSFILTLPGMKERYKYGPKVSLPHWTQNNIAGICLASLFIINYLPDQLFFAIWFSPLEPYIRRHPGRGILPAAAAFQRFQWEKRDIELAKAEAQRQLLLQTQRMKDHAPAEHHPGAES